MRNEGIQNYERASLPVAESSGGLDALPLTTAETHLTNLRQQMLFSGTRARRKDRSWAK